MTLDHLGEHVRGEQDARAAAGEAMTIFDRISREKLNANVSIKPTQMGLGLGYYVCKENLEALVVHARKLDNFLRIDMEDSGVTQATLDLFFGMHSAHENVGIVIQAYLLRSEYDVRRVLDVKGRIRLCKGAYREPRQVAYQRKRDVDQNFIRLMKLLLDSNIHHGIATHDENMIRATIDYARANRIPKGAFEFQMLYGIRRDMQRQLVGDGYAVRIYVPYGSDWYPYNMRRLAERPANLFFLLKNLFRQ